MLEGGHTTDLCPYVHLSFAIVICELGSCLSAWSRVKDVFQRNSEKRLSAIIRKSYRASSLFCPLQKRIEEMALHFFFHVGRRRCDIGIKIES